MQQATSMTIPFASQPAQFAATSSARRTEQRARLQPGDRRDTSADEDSSSSRSNSSSEEDSDMFDPEDEQYYGNDDNTMNRILTVVVQGQRTNNQRLRQLLRDFPTRDHLDLRSTSKQKQQEINQYIGEMSRSIQAMTAGCIATSLNTTKALVFLQAHLAHTATTAQPLDLPADPPVEPVRRRIRFTATTVVRTAARVSLFLCFSFCFVEP